MRVHKQSHTDTCPRSQRPAPTKYEDDAAALPSEGNEAEEAKEDESDASSVKSPHVQRGGKRRRDTHADKVIAASSASIERLTSVVERALQGLAQASAPVQSELRVLAPGIPVPPPMQPNQDREDYCRALSAFYGALANKPAHAP